MASTIGPILAVAILLLSSLAEAFPAEVTCLQIQQTGNDFASCLARHADDDGHGTEVIGTGEAAVDLRTGLLRSHAIAQAYSSGTTDLNVSGGSIAQIFDTVTIGGGYNGVVGLQMDVSGAFLLNDPVGFQDFPTLNTYLSLFTQTQENTAFVLVEEYSGGGGLFVTQRMTGNAGYSADVNDLADVRVVLTASFVVTPSTRTFSVLARLATSSAISHGNQGDHVHVSDVNFGDTAHLSLVLPQGVPWTSGSGAFLVDVPEPGTGALLAVGLLGLTALRPVRR